MTISAFLVVTELFPFQDKLKGQDFETNSLYISNRASSGGHVKIGWTVKSVQEHLNGRSRCEYIRNLVFSERNIPFS